VDANSETPGTANTVTNRSNIQAKRQILAHLLLVHFV